jgi:hypothetical protein
MRHNKLISRVVFSYRRETRRYNRNQLLFILDALLINASIILTAGFFISGYIVHLGGSDFLTGIINSSISWASVASVFSFIIYEKMKTRKTFLIILVTISRLLVCSSVFVPLFIKDNTAALYTACGMIIAGNILWGIYAIGWMVWIIGVSPTKTRNGYLYSRMLYLRISFTIVTIVMGLVLDLFNKSYAGFVVVFGAALVLAVADIIILVRIKEPDKYSDRQTKFNFSMFWDPLKSKDYRKYLTFTLLFYVSLTMSTSYTPVYLIKYLDFDYAFISAVTVAMYVSMILFTRFWKRIEYNRGIKYVFYMTASFVAAEVLIYGFLIRERFYLLLLAPILSGIGNSGFNICVMNHRYNIMPDENRTVYEGWFNAVFGLSTFIAPVIGGVLLEMLPTIENPVFKHSSFQFLYLISFVLSGLIIFIFFSGKKSFCPRKNPLTKQGS